MVKGFVRGFSPLIFLGSLHGGGLSGNEEIAQIIDKGFLLEFL